MFRRALPAALAAATCLTLAACGGEDSASTEAADATLPTQTSAAPTSAEPDGPARSDRGNIIKQIGEEGGNSLDENSDELVFRFAVDAIRVDQECNSGYPQEPTNGHFIGIDVRAATTANLPPDFFVQMSADQFQVIGPDGLTVTDVWGTAYSCLDSASSFTSDQLGPAQQYAGTVVIDSPVTSGTLVYKHPGDTTGWEWQF
ncbi:hypothetical protein ACI79G_07085 [Geodermatophilus sp. SYSU D00779]